MKFKEYITENDNLDDIIDKVRKDCSYFLKESKGEPLYRGINNYVIDYGIKKVRKDRKPRNTYLEYHELLDDMFKDEFGWNARSGGLFCTGHYDGALGYGRVYYIFPKGKFKFIWSDNIRDLYSTIDDFIYSNNSRMRRMGIPEDERPDQIFDMFKDTEAKKLMFKYNDKNLNSAIKSGNEIMIDCKEYYYINNIVIRDYKETFGI